MDSDQIWWQLSSPICDQNWDKMYSEPVDRPCEQDAAPFVSKSGINPGAKY